MNQIMLIHSSLKRKKIFKKLLKEMEIDQSGIYPYDGEYLREDSVNGSFGNNRYSD